MKQLCIAILTGIFSLESLADKSKNAIEFWDEATMQCPDNKDFNNGCGSGWNESFVPEKFQTIKIDFTDACANHDNCYSKCLRVGSNYCTSECKKIAKDQREGRRTTCDENFRDNMKAKCSSSACRGLAFLYFQAVRIAGGGNFQGMEIPEDFYKFIESTNAENFDFDSLANDIENLRAIPALSQSNKLILNIVDNRLSPSLISTTATMKKELKIQKDFVTFDKLFYGNIDLTNANHGKRKFRFEGKELKSLDPNLFKLERSYQKIGP